MTLRVLVAGALSTPPGHGGMAWSVLQYVLGLRRLGHEVIFVEPMRREDLVPRGTSLEDSANVAYLERVARSYGFGAGWAALLAGTRETVGLSYRALDLVARRTNVVLNLSGHLTDPDLLGPAPVRIYLDLDPGFTQLWQAVEGADLRLAGHSHYVTLAHDFGQPACPIPTLGLPWLPTIPPVVLDRWPVAEDQPRRGLTTVGSWRSYGSIQHAGRSYGQKVHTVRALLDLSRRVDVPVEVAFGVHPDERPDLAALDSAGWHLQDPAVVAATPEAYQTFVQESWGELGVAKQGYAVAQCGWFSERSACYLASGRPVIALDTGFGAHLPTGRGLLAFTSVDEAVAAIGEVAGGYRGHAEAAREIAAAYLDSDRVLSRLIDAVHADSAPRSSGDADA